ncbi:uncharacterized protein LOC108044407 [Drosophila rhopaloa]|uniref:Uncharacterized protein LOC108044407 n=1 Tax=Drosophila rhopaloa TaxID=1041015 RepID=A0A6P4EUX1_DRORH|nr:uncharacterized protein LOC108044407 [Drosophila rhopaloa]
MSLLLETDHIHFEFSLGSGQILASEAVKLLTLCKEIAYLKPPKTSHHRYENKLQIEEQDGEDDHNGEYSLAEADDHGPDEVMKVTTPATAGGPPEIAGGELTKSKSNALIIEVIDSPAERFSASSPNYV